MQVIIKLYKRTEQGSNSAKNLLADIDFDGDMNELKELIRRLTGKLDDNCYWFCE